MLDKFEIFDVLFIIYDNSKPFFLKLDFRVFGSAKNHRVRPDPDNLRVLDNLPAASNSHRGRNFAQKGPPT